MSKGKAKRVRVHCDQCSMLMINGVACHETGCPNQGSRWDAGSECWIKQRECSECGCTVDADDPCCNAPFDDEDFDEPEDLDDDPDELEDNLEEEAL